MATLIISTGRTGYADVVKVVRSVGQPRSPRGRKTYDLGHTDVIIDSPYDALPLGIGRNLLPAIGAAEAAQLVAGRAYHSLMPRISPTFARYAESSGLFHGAYGERIAGQVGAIVRKIVSDRETRQAVITLWDPTRDNLPNKRDYPCTVALNFTVVREQLELRTLMRSNDVWLGFPYDIFQFTQLQLTVARALSIEPGRYTHTAWSLHLYAEHADLVDQLTPALPAGPFQPAGFGKLGHDWLLCSWRADAILRGVLNHSFDLSDSERWYDEHLGPYVRD